MKIEIVSDISCPWCFVAKARLRRALDEFPHADHIDVEYLPFQLNPSLPRTPQPGFTALLTRAAAEPSAVAGLSSRHRLHRLTAYQLAPAKGYGRSV